MPLTGLVNGRRRAVGVTITKRPQKLTRIIHNIIIPEFKSEAVGDGGVIVEIDIQDFYRQRHLTLPQIQLPQVVLSHRNQRGIANQGDCAQPGIGGGLQAQQGALFGPEGFHRGLLCGLGGLGTRRR